MSTMIADRFYDESTAAATQRNKPSLLGRVFNAMIAGRQAQAQRAIYQFYATKSDAELRDFGLPEKTITHVRKYYG
jgi:hypothetical protein